MVSPIYPNFTRLPNLERFLDNQQTAFVREIYPRTGFPIGEELREVVSKEYFGGWHFRHRSSTNYDTLIIPHNNGLLVIERPWIGIARREMKGHIVRFSGEMTPILEESIKELLKEMHEKERAKARELFLKFDQRFSPQESLELAKSF